ncbi:MAG: glycosyltransferase [Gammaproteobacteria bacterium]
MIRVLHISSSLEIGGAELFLERLIGTMDSTRFSHSVVTLFNMGKVGEHLRAHGINVTVLETRKAVPFMGLWRLRNIIRTEKPDLIQSWLYNSNIAASLARILTGIRCPLIWNVRHSLDAWQAEPWDTRFTIRLGGILSRTPTQVIFNSGRAVGQHERYGYRKDRAVVIPNGIDGAHFYPDEGKRADMRARLGLDESDVVVGTLGRFHTLKNQVGFLRAAHSMLGQRADLRFVMAGGGVTPDNGHLIRLIRELELSDRVLLLGEVDETAALLNAMDIFVSPSLAEGFPNAVGEAMACGRPCVVTDAGASAELVSDAGIVVPRDAPQALADAVVGMVNAGRERRHDLGVLARQRILQEYDQTRIAERYAVLYEEMAAIHSSNPEMDKK